MFLVVQPFLYSAMYVTKPFPYSPINTHDSSRSTVLLLSLILSLLINTHVPSSSTAPLLIYKCECSFPLPCLFLILQPPSIALPRAFQPFLYSPTRASNTAILPLPSNRPQEQCSPSYALLHAFLCQTVPAAHSSPPLMPRQRRQAGR